MYNFCAYINKKGNNVNRIFKKLLSKSLGCVVVVSENTKSIGKASKSEGIVEINETLQELLVCTLKNKYPLKPIIITLSLSTITLMTQQVLAEQIIVCGAKGSNTSPGIGAITHNNSIVSQQYWGSLNCFNNSPISDSKILNDDFEVTINADTLKVGSGGITSKDSLSGAGNGTVSFNSNKITNLLNGTSANDAVNFGQLNSLANVFGGGAGFSGGVFTGPTYTIQGSNYTNIGNAFTAVNTKLTSLQGQIDALPGGGGADGKSAYDIAVDNGYTGSQSQWLASLKGDKGDVGATGAQGAQGVKGDKGDVGATGAQGKSAYEVAVDNGYNGTAQDWLTSQSGNSPYLDANPTTTSTGAKATGTGATALGDGAVADGDNNTVLGSGASAKGESNTVVGKGNTVEGNKSGAFGDPNLVQGNGSYAVGNDNTINSDNSFVVGNNVNTSAKNSVVLGNDSASTRDNSVSVGASGKERQIIHVAAGIEDTDAVNVKQMKDGNAKVLTDAKAYTDTKVLDLENNFRDTSNRIDQTNHDVRKNREIAAQGIAGITAMTNIPMPSEQGASTVGLGMGHFDSQSAIAVGASHYFENGVAVKGAFSSGFNNGNTTAVGAGVSYSWK